MTPSGAVDAREGAGGDGTPFVEDEPRLHAARPQDVDGVACAAAEDLLVAAEGEPHVARGSSTVGEQRLERSDGGDELALVVERPAAPELPVDDLAGQGRVGPALLVAERDDVEVRHEHDRVAAVVGRGGVGGHPDEQAVRLDLDDLLGHDLREVPAERLVGGDEGGLVVRAARGGGDRGQAQELLQGTEGVSGDRHAARPYRPVAMKGVSLADSRRSGRHPRRAR